MTDGARVGASARAGSLDSRTHPTLPIPVQRPVRRRRRGPRVLLAVLIVLVVLLAAFLIGDRVFRSAAEGQIERSVSQSLPPGVTGKVSARIGGASALLQYLHGSFDDVTLTSKGLQVANAPASAVVHLAGLPVDGGRVRRATATFVIGQAAFKKVPALQQAGASPPRFGPGRVSTTLTRKVLGLDVKVGVTLTPSLSGQTVHLRPTAATLTAGPATIPATAIVQQLLPDGVSVCAASYLPRGVDLTSVRVRTGEAVVGLDASNVDLRTLDSAPTGSCR